MRGRNRPDAPMFFTLSKTVGLLALPSNLLILLAVLGTALLFSRFARAGRRLLVASLAAVVAIGITPLGSALIYPLESRFPPWDGAHGAPAGFIVLGGAIEPDVSAAHGQPALTDSGERITILAELARRYPKARLIFSGGNGSLIGGSASEADYALRLLESFGIARARIELEGRARNTIENAQFSKAITAPKPGERWVLVTSAYHMPRAIGVFRQAGFAVEAHPVDWRLGGREEMYGPFRTFTGGLARTDEAAREWLGLATYWLTGRSSELFPGP